jgi:hypothetical protein
MAPWVFPKASAAVLARLGHVVGGVGVAVAQRLLRPGGGVLGRLQLHLSVQLGAQPVIMPWDQLREGIGSRTEFCIGGPDSNARTGAHLRSYLPGVAKRPYNPARRDSMAFVIGDQRYLRERDKQEFAVVAKFLPRGASRPVFVISGQTAITNWASVHFLNSNYKRLAKSLASPERFCLVLRITSPELYGHKMVELEADVSTAAFETPKERSSSGGSI